MSENALPEQEQLALLNIRSEARGNNATLDSDGRGSLPPSLVLGVFRRDRWECSRCETRHSLTIHHKKLLCKTRHNELCNLTTVCIECHAAIHKGGFQWT
jgi:5-methylcytosine-specific restriction endonuclease McrA